ncbi:MAG TPA: TIR domain-containing protein [Vitreimonas sp.]|uniref:TIR domain-containing protein n=1 Tax=Vitreimonas sp. TaxID=3069702 RepID=UPI002D60AC95|nr:TIR domain-containing protein [Vitreimonas sp.]HYD88185.1 TIR domain-containing protein [Vitreimonas sp.]
MADVFISYKAERRQAAQHMASVLSAYGYSVWWDYALIAGRDFTRQIENELKAAKVVVVLWCGLSRDSEWVRQEALFAKSRGQAVPVFIEPVDLPFGFQLDHTINLAGWDGAPSDQAALEQLLRELERLTGRAPQPDAHALSALESAWRAAGAPALPALPLGPKLEPHAPPFAAPKQRAFLTSPFAWAVGGLAAAAVATIALWLREAPTSVVPDAAGPESLAVDQTLQTSAAVPPASPQAAPTAAPISAPGATEDAAATSPPRWVSPCVIQPFEIYFAYDRTSLNSEARSALEDALLRARRCEIESVRIIGHDETEASPAYSIGVSERRASAVRDFLVEQGVAAEVISTEARGQHALAVETGPGVREPLNRRATVELQLRLRD